MSDWHTCRKCGETSFHAHDDMVKYGPRHWAHVKCWLDAGGKLKDLPAWRIAKLPYFMLKERGLLDEAMAIAGHLLKLEANEPP